VARLAHDYAAEIRRTLTDPRRLCDRLGLGKDAQRQAGNGILVRCPAHEERTPSCSVTNGPDGTIRCRCFACGWTGDALTLVAAVHGLDVRSGFRDVLIEAAAIAGLAAAVDELRGDKPYYPPAQDVETLWRATGPASDDPDSAAHLSGRGIDPSNASRLGLVRALCLKTGLWCQLPQWARYRGDWWPAHGFRLVIPVYDVTGTMRSVRAWRVTDGEGPKRLPPSGHRATGLVLANERARQILSGETRAPARVVLVEGEPDMVSVSLRWPWLPVLGVYSGSWTDEIAARIPFGSELIVRTHHDEAGDRYADEIVKSTKARAVVRRSNAA
jgi:hypothetical protein